MIGHKFDHFFADWRLTTNDEAITSPDGKHCLLFMDVYHYPSSSVFRDSVLNSGPTTPLLTNVHGWVRYQFKCAAKRKWKALKAAKNNDGNLALLETTGVASKSSMVGFLLSRK
jgi:hypothetical protein